MHINRMLVAALALGAGVLSAQAAPPTTQPVRSGPLAGLPSAPGPHIQKIEALGDNEWVELGPPAPDPKWGLARGRSWSSRMVLAPDLGGAFFHGQGVHGYVKPDGYFMDDIWFYDANAHRWICLYPGTDTRNFVENIRKGELTVNDDGQLTDKAGNVVPFSSIAGHSYQDHAYDSDRGRYLFGGHVDGIGSEQHVRDKPWCKDGRALLLAQGKADKSAGAPYVLNTITGRFERPPAGSVGRSHGGAGGSFMVDLVYLPTRKVFWQHSQGTVRLSDPATHRWIDPKAKGTPPKGGDVGVCYDSKRDRIYVCGAVSPGPDGADEGAVHIYDVASNTWSRPANKGKAPSGLTSANRACTHYDSVNDRMIVLVFRGDRDVLGVYAYDPETASWGQAPAPVPPAFAADRGCGHGFYSPQLNAHLFYRAGDSNDRGTMWAYRHQRAATGP